MYTIRIDHKDGRFACRIGGDAMGGEVGFDIGDTEYLRKCLNSFFFEQKLPFCAMAEEVEED